MSLVKFNEVKPILDKIGVKYSVHPNLDKFPDDMLEELETFCATLLDGPIGKWKKVRASQTEDQWAAYGMLLDDDDVEDFHEVKLLKEAEKEVKDAMRSRPKIMRYRVKNESAKSKE